MKSLSKLLRRVSFAFSRSTKLKISFARVYSLPARCHHRQQEVGLAQFSSALIRAHEDVQYAIVILICLPLPFNSPQLPSTILRFLLCNNGE